MALGRGYWLNSDTGAYHRIFEHSMDVRERPGCST